MSDFHPKSTDAQRRRMTRKMDLRERIRGHAYLRVLEGIAATVLSAEPDRVPAYRVKADIYLKLLNKVLPDLKAIEHTGDKGRADPKDMTADELSRRIATLEREISEREGTTRPPPSERALSEVH